MRNSTNNTIQTRRLSPRGRPINTLPIVCLLLLVVAGYGALRQASPTSHASSRGVTVSKARLSQAVSAKASRSGNPAVNLADGRDVIASYSGSSELTQALEQNQAEPLAVASDDFDEDGVADLVIGYGHSASGIITLHRGSLEAIYRDNWKRDEGSPDLTAPFLAPAQVFGAAVKPEFIGTGDFDNDGHWDVVAASRESNALYLMSGDGKGGFGEARRIELPGVVTAMMTGEINRRDGLADVVVAVKGADGAKALVFEGPEGALRSEPEVFDLASEATALAVGQLDDEYTLDLAVAAGKELIVIGGRDRKLSSDKEARATVKQAKTSRRELGFGVKSMAIGDFSGNHRTDIALLTEDGAVQVLSEERQEAKGKRQNLAQDALSRRAAKVVEQGRIDLLTADRWPAAKALVSARVSAASGDDLVVIDSASRQLHIVTSAGESVAGAAAHRVAASVIAESEPVTVMAMRLNGDGLGDLVMLRSSASVPTVMSSQPQSAFIVINTNDSGVGSLRQAITSANNNPGADTINFNIAGAGPHTITPLTELPNITDTVTIDGYSQPGASVNTLPGGDNAVLKIELNGINYTNPGLIDGVMVLVAENCVVRGLVVNRNPTRNGLELFRNNCLIEGNFVGTDPTGTIARGNNSSGILILSSNNTIGGTTPAARNLISSNGTGIQVDGSNSLPGIAADNNSIKGNFINTTASGTALLAVQSFGINTFQTNNNTIGGTTANARNIVTCMEGNGIDVGFPSGSLVQGNYVGLDVTGTVSLGRPFVSVVVTKGTIGGTAVGAGNVITSALAGEVGVYDTTDLNVVQGNILGLNAAGTAPVGYVDQGGGITVNGRNTLIGGTTSTARNIISGTGSNGIFIDSGGTPTFNITVQGNYIGTDITGTVPIPNGFNAVRIQDCTDIKIGGPEAGARNIIFGPISIFDPLGLSDNVTIQNNFIGTDVTGTIDLGNPGFGIGTANVVKPLFILDNVISGNGGNGISLGAFTSFQGQSGFGGQGATVRGNFIGTDPGGTIDLGNTGCGIFVENNSLIHTIENNVIAFNDGGGICIPNNPGDPQAAGTPAFRISLVSNRVFSNTGMGIDLGLPGISANDPGDPDAGANIQQNFPALTSATTAGPVMFTGGGSSPSTTATIRILGNINSTPNTDFFVQFFSMADCSGINPVGNQQSLTVLPYVVHSDFAGNVAIDVTLQNVTIAGNWINATARTETGNTSEFSQCILLNSAASCNYSIGPTGQTFPASGGAGSVAVTAGPGCVWTAVSNDSFITVTGGPDGTGNGTVSYRVDANTGTTERIGTVMIAGQTFAVTQAGAPTPCTFFLSPQNQNFTATGGAGVFGVSTQGGCNWTAFTDVGWITTSSSGTGNGQISYFVEANTSSQRTGHIFVEGQVYTVTQDGAASPCTFSIFPTSVSIPGTGGSGSFTLTTQGGCVWSAAADVPWIDFSTSGAGSGPVNYAVGINAGPARTGHVFVEGLTFTINQAAGCSFTLGAMSKSFAAGGGSESVTVTALSSCTWTATSNNPNFITITSGSINTGSGTVSYTVNANAGMSTRGGTIRIAGQTYTVVQGAAFFDVPPSHIFYTEIGKLSARGITMGCGGGNYCPDAAVTREQMAAFIIRGLGEFAPPQPQSQRFLDVPPTNPFYAFIEQMAVRQITSGCGGVNYCPGSAVTREQMAAFIIRGIGEFNPPQPGSQRFGDVPTTNPFYNFIDRMAALGITSGCSASPPLYCPGATVTRGQMAVFLVRAFNL
jgi:VCBS repeat protein/S-layer family protein/all-beta uncharacterized protein